MLGLMMDQPLLVSDLIQFADRHHADAEIVSKTVEGNLHRYTYRDAHLRARKVAQALGRLGIQPGDRVGTLAWNGYRHYELYYGISGIGAVINTINPRLFPEQIAYIANHAEDQALFFDLTFLPLVEKLAPQLSTVKHFVLMSDRGHMPATTAIPKLLCYEELVAAEDGKFQWPTFDERTACGLCYTSGTTGNPKGVLYSHRSTMLHAYGAALPDALNVGARDCILPVVPMFHVNAWSLPYACTMVGAKLVLPGPHLDGKSVYELMESEKVTCSAGVPTVTRRQLSSIGCEPCKFLISTPCRLIRSKVRNASETRNRMKFAWDGQARTSGMSASAWKSGPRAVTIASACSLSRSTFSTSLAAMACVRLLML